MLLHLYRFARAERLVDALARQLCDHWPADPFAPVAVVVGSRGMERWLRHELATRLGALARVEFPFPRPAFDGAMRWLADSGRDPEAVFWRSPPAPGDPWRPDALAFRLIEPLRRRRDEPDFAAVAAYLHDGGSIGPEGAVRGRELRFAREVADVLDRMLHDRGADALQWAHDPQTAPERHRWLALLLGELARSTTPADDLRTVQQQPAPRIERHLHVFGLSTLGRGELDRLAALARSLDVHFYVLAPSHVWWADFRSQREARRDLLRAGTADVARIEAELTQQNPLLAAFGRPSRDLQWWLEDHGYQGDDDPDAPPPALICRFRGHVHASRHSRSERNATTDRPDGESWPSTTLLQRVQQWIADAEPLPSTLPAVADHADGSLAFHSACGALRQVEVLRDELLARFAADPTLQPRDVLVMTPDIETYAPLCAAVFARTGSAVVMPTAIADLGLRRTNPLAEALLRVLALGGERVTGSALLELLALAPVQRRFGIAAEQLGDLRELCRDSGLRWGIDAADRATFDQPALDQNTVRFGLERLALGVLLPEDAGLELVPGLPMPLVPVPVVGRGRTALAGAWLALARAVGHWREQLGPARPVAQWRERLAAALDEFTTPAASEAWLRSDVLRVLDALRDDAEAWPGPVERAAVLRWLEGRFELPQHGDRSITGAVTVCALEPMRSVPFRVVALLGLDDGAFPRTRKPAAWDPTGDNTRLGDHDRRDVDRHLLLEALLSARDGLWLFWSGRDVRSGRVLPAAVPIEELLETTALLCRCQRRDLVREHPLQPWSPAEFAASGPHAFDAQLCAAAQRMADDRAQGQRPRSAGIGDRSAAVLPPEAEPPQRIGVAQLAKGLTHPQRMLVAERLGIALPEDVAPLDDREPLALNGLDAWRQRDRLLRSDLGVAGDAGVQLAELAAGCGEAPLGMAGPRAVQVQHERVRKARLVADAAVGVTAKVAAMAVELADGTTVHAPELGGRCDGDRWLLQWTTASGKPNEALRLEAWAALLVARAAGPGDCSAHLVGTADKDGDAQIWLAAPSDADSARALLADLVSLWRLARCRPVPLFAKTSMGLAQLARNESGRARTAARVLADWFHEDYGDVRDPAVRALYGDFDPVAALDDPTTDALVGLALRVWGPFLAAVDAGKAEKARWSAQEVDG
jgi:exodeoxyribonuclease V gamma subunit